MRLLIAAPFLIVLILFVLSNRQQVSLGFWPTDFQLAAPLSVTVLVVAGAAFLLGALVVWMAELGQRRRARRAEARAQLLEEQVQSLEARLPSATPPPVT